MTRASLFLSFHFPPPPLSSLFLSVYLYFSPLHLSICILHSFLFLCPAFLLSVLVYFYYIWIILYQSLIFAQTTESTHTHTIQTHSQMLVMRCTGAYPLSERCFSPHFPLIWCWESHFTAEKASLTGTHTHACVGIIHATEKWCRSYKSQSATEYIRPLNISVYIMHKVL